MPNLAPLRFKDYVWPHNPTIYGIRFVKDLIQHNYPNINGAEIEDLALDARVFTGSGEFFGEDAYEQFGQLANKFYERGPGKLIHPIWMATDAVFSRLEVSQEPTPNYVKYEFEFIEYRKINIIEELPDVNQNTPESQPEQPQKEEEKIIHIVKQGETLSRIGSKYGVPWRKIADANKDIIKNPNIIQIGWKLTIPK